MKIIRKDIHIQPGGLFDLFDNSIKIGFNITDEELDFICKTATDEELDVFITALGSLGEAASFSKRKSALIIRNKYLDLFNTTK
jgi:hypothetical protein